MVRDAITETQAKLKIDSQMTIEQKKALAHYVIDNTGLRSDTRRQTEELIGRLAPSTANVVFMWYAY